MIRMSQNAIEQIAVTAIQAGIGVLVPVAIDATIKTATRFQAALRARHESREPKPAEVLEVMDA